MKQAHANKIKASVKTAYSAIAFDFDQTRKQPWKEFEDFLKYIKNGDHILDLGCGNGRLYDFFIQKGLKVDYLGVDHNADFLKLAQKNFPQAKFQEGDLEDPGISNNHFDGIFCVAAFHHLPDKKSRQKALESMHSALKPNGILVLTVWNLFQWKYWKQWLRAIIHNLITFGQKLKWNDLWIKWGKFPLSRYYHAFLPNEFLRYFSKNYWSIEEIYFSRKGKRVSFWRSFNIVIVAKKINH